MDSADVVIIGGGVTGLSSAFWLAKAGRDVLVVEKGIVGWEASGRNGGLASLRGDDTPVVPIAAESLQLWPTMDDELGYPTEWVGKGRAVIALDEERMATLTGSARRWAALDIPVRVVTPAELRELVPCLTPSVVGGLYSSRAGHANPQRTSQAFAWAILDRGGRIYQQTTVTGIRVVKGKVMGVETTRGPIAAETVVSCAGPQTAHVGKWVGLEIPIAPGPGRDHRDGAGGPGVRGGCLRQRALRAADPPGEDVREERLYVDYPPYINALTACSPGGPKHPLPAAASLSAVSVVRVLRAPPEALVTSANYARDGHLYALHVNGSRQGAWVHSNDLQRLHPGAFGVATMIGDRPRTRATFGLPETFPVIAHVQGGVDVLGAAAFPSVLDAVLLHYERGRVVRRDLHDPSRRVSSTFLRFEHTPKDQVLDTVDRRRGFADVPYTRDERFKRGFRDR
jgi:hypothetical protein